MKWRSSCPSCSVHHITIHPNLFFCDCTCSSQTTKKTATHLKTKLIILFVCFFLLTMRAVRRKTNLISEEKNKKKTKWFIHKYYSGLPFFVELCMVLCLRVTIVMYRLVSLEKNDNYAKIIGAKYVFYFW